jgi:hypothetical protein
MPNRFAAAAAAAVGVVLATAGVAAADDCASSSTAAAGAFNNPPLYFQDGQDGLLNLDSPVADARCAAPWYGSAVAGGSTPLHMQNVVCNSVNAPVEQIQDHPEGGLLF